MVTKYFLLQIDYNFMVKDSKDFIVSNRRVSELLVEGERRWDAENIMNLFSLREYRVILSISLSLHTCHYHLLLMEIDRKILEVRCFIEG